MSSSHVVVDGSNLATEGRTLPSLVQLEEAIAAYEEENPGVEIIVVVDATFEHRVEAAERERLKEAELHGEVVSPPAGAIGRGDAFVLKIAKRTGGVVLSNDSFQEFHGEHPWLFDEGRLIGGKPVTGVGWIFTPRTPVRGPKSRAATQSAKRASTGPAKKLKVTRPDGSAPVVGDVLTPGAPPPAPPPKSMRAYQLAKELGISNAELLALAKAQGVALSSHSSSVLPADASRLRAALESAESAKKIRAYELAKELGISNAELKSIASRAGVEVASHSSSLNRSDVETIRTAAMAQRRRATVVADAASDGPEESEAAMSASGPKRSRRRRRSGASKGEAATQGASPALETPESEESPNEDGVVKKPAKARRGAKAATDAPPSPRGPTPTNAPLDLVTFVSMYEVGSEIEGVVAQFTSHGAMVDVALGEAGTFRCYAPTERLGTPPPKKARDVLTRGEAARFKVVAVDPARRVAELELV